MILKLFLLTLIALVLSCTAGQASRTLDVVDAGNALSGLVGAPAPVTDLVTAITDPLKDRLKEIDAELAKSGATERKLSLENWLYILGINGGVVGSALIALNKYRNGTRETEKLRAKAGNLA